MPAPTSEDDKSKAVTSENSPLVPDEDKTVYECECLDCGHTLKTTEHCSDVECPECGGKMRRKERPGPGKTDFAKVRRQAVVRRVCAEPQLQAKQESTEGNGGIRGYLSVFNVVDSWNEVVLPGAFEKSLSERKVWPLMVKHVAYGGTVADVVGSFTAREDERGLLIDADYLDTTLAQDTRKKTDAGIVDGLSVGYRELKSNDGEFDGRQNVRQLAELALVEGTVCVAPANDEALIIAAKSLESRVLEVLRFADADGKGRQLSEVVQERVEKLLPDLNMVSELLRGLVSQQPNAKGPLLTVDVEGRRRRLDLMAARIRAASIGVT